MPRRDDSPAYAHNWRTVLVADAALGMVAVAIGLVVMGSGSLPMGAGLVAFGAAYVVLVMRRAMRWRSLRRAAGLSR